MLSKLSHASRERRKRRTATCRPWAEALEDRVALSVITEAPEPNDSRYKPISGAKSYELRGNVGGVVKRNTDGSDKFEVVSRPGQLLKISFGAGTGTSVNIRVAGTTHAVGPDHIVSGAMGSNTKFLEVYSNSGTIQLIVSTAGVSRPHPYDILVTSLATKATPTNFKVEPLDESDAEDVRRDFDLSVNTQVVKVTWESSTGNRDDLSGVTFREKLFYYAPGQPAPGPGVSFKPPPPFGFDDGFSIRNNPDPQDNIYRPNTPNGFDANGDVHDVMYTSVKPGEQVSVAIDSHIPTWFNPVWTGTKDHGVLETVASYTTYQQYQWRADNVNGGNWINIGAPIRIVRSIEYIGKEGIPFVSGKKEYYHYRYTISLPGLHMAPRTQDILEPVKPFEPL
jgi:hypothetical protein